MQINNARLGGLKRIELYGNPGTATGRSKGGKKTTALFRLNPEHARAVGFTIRKTINYPERSSILAEFVGIMLGDGGLPGNHQLTISFNYKTDKQYAEYVGSILKRLFFIDYNLHKRRNSAGADIVVSSSDLVKFLMQQGLMAGNKIKNQVDVPYWIKENIDYQVSCLRGLMDTDGGLYLHTYHSRGKIYKYLKLCFTNHSKPLLFFVYNVLKQLGFKAYLNGNHVSIYSMMEVAKYFKKVDTHNIKHGSKFEGHFGKN